MRDDLLLTFSPYSSKLKIRLIPALTILVVIATAMALGFWQLQRAHYKEQLQQKIDSAKKLPVINLHNQKQLWDSKSALNNIWFRRINATGVFMPKQVIYLDNRPFQDQAGFYVVMPFKLADGRIVLVNRGWLPRDPIERTKIAPFFTPTQPISIQGIVRADPTRMFELHGSAGQIKPHVEMPSIRANLDAKAFAKETGLPILPFFIMQTSAVNDGLIRQWLAANSGAARNYGYMVQWWGLAIAAFIYGLLLARRSGRDKRVNVIKPESKADTKADTNTGTKASKTSV